MHGGQPWQQTTLRFLQLQLGSYYLNININLNYEYKVKVLSISSMRINIE